MWKRRCTDDRTPPCACHQPRVGAASGESEAKRPATAAPTAIQSATSRKRRKGASPTAKATKTIKGLKPSKSQPSVAEFAVAASAAAGGSAGPSARWGHSLSLLTPTEALLVGGQGSTALSKDGVWKLDFPSRSWTEVSGDSLPTRTGHAAVADAVGGKVVPRGLPGSIHAATHTRRLLPATSYDYVCALTDPGRAIFYYILLSTSTDVGFWRC